MVVVVPLFDIRVQILKRLKFDVDNGINGFERKHHARQLYYHLGTCPSFGCLESSRIAMRQLRSGRNFRDRNAAASSRKDHQDKSTKNNITPF
jgi:hypothetical protein